jgi:hypothetical protein
VIDTMRRQRNTARRFGDGIPDFRVAFAGVRRDAGEFHWPDKTPDAAQIYGCAPLIWVIMVAANDRGH